MYLAKQLKTILNNITMYRLVVYVLAMLSALGIGLALVGHMSTSATAMVVSLFLLLVSAYLTDRGFARWFDVPTNSESWLITALILFLIVHPATSVLSAVALVLAGAVSSASKFLVARHEKHLFNPAALAAAVLSLTGLQATTWWVGSAIFWPFVLLFGLAVAYKIRRLPMVAVFVGTALACQLIQVAWDHQSLATSLQHAIFSSPLIFLATIMLTEPATMPPRQNQQLIFAAGVAALYVAGWQLGPFIIYPEVALLLGNVYAYAVSPKFRLRLTLARVQQVSGNVYNYVFTPNRPFSFVAGQYMEWTLPHVPYDSRGNRRTFTIASSPTEDEVHLGLKYYHPASAYKTAFSQLRPGDVVYASQLAGSFTLPDTKRAKLVFIAGGIGITPFRSMTQYLLDTGQQANIVILYAVNHASELVYMDDLTAAAKVGVKVIPIITGDHLATPPMVNGKLSAQLITQLVPDFGECTFYISGPNAMVDATTGYLNSLGVPSAHVKRDYFSGY